MEALENFKKISGNVYALTYPNGEVNIVTLNDNKEFTGQIILTKTDLKKILEK